MKMKWLAGILAVLVLLAPAGAICQPYEYSPAEPPAAGTALPQEGGKARSGATGTAAAYSREDHVHPLTWSTDFLYAAAPYPWFGSAVSSGTQSSTPSAANHPGISRISSSTTTNSGWSIATNLAALLLVGGEETECVFSVITTASTTVRIGFLDANSSAQPTDGCWLEVAGTTASGYCKNNAGPTQTGTTYTITQGTWYRGTIAVNAAASSVVFALFTADGSQVWTGTVAANIPTTTGRETGHGVIATNSGTTALALIDVDYLSLSFGQPLAR